VPRAAVQLARRQGGLGVGLTLVRPPVGLHGGKIRAHSEGLGRGSAFSVELPLVQANVAPQPPASEPERARADRATRILLVEDNMDLLEMARDTLESFGYEVTTANDGADGLAALTAHPPDVAFIDIGLPTLDGYAIASGARERGINCYLVAMTGYGQPEDHRRALAAGFDLHVTKPVTATVLRKVIEDSPPAARD